MDVNSAGWSQKEFIDMAQGFCFDEKNSMCERTGYACKDYLCPIVKMARDINEVRSAFENQC